MRLSALVSAAAAAAAAMAAAAPAMTLDQVKQSLVTGLNGAYPAVATAVQGAPDWDIISTAVIGMAAD